MSLKMTIELSDGGINITGPLEDKPLCYALLRGAEELIKEYPKNKVVGNVGNPSISSPLRNN